MYLFIMLSFFSRYRNNPYTYNTQIDKYIKKIETDLQKKKIATELIVCNNVKPCKSLEWTSLFGFLCFLAGYKLAKNSLL